MEIITNEFIKGFQDHLYEEERSSNTIMVLCEMTDVFILKTYPER